MHEKVSKTEKNRERRLAGNSIESETRWKVCHHKQTKGTTPAPITEKKKKRTHREKEGENNPLYKGEGTMRR